MSDEEWFRGVGDAIDRWLWTLYTALGFVAGFATATLVAWGMP
jgi:hypothetical protein